MIMPEDLARRRPAAKVLTRSLGGHVAYTQSILHFCGQLIMLWFIEGRRWAVLGGRWPRQH